MTFTAICWFRKIFMNYTGLRKLNHKRWKETPLTEYRQLIANFIFNSGIMKISQLTSGIRKAATSYDQFYLHLH